MRGDLPFPVAVLKESALAHNLAWMADFTRATGVLLAPHGKTTMAPQLFARQIEAGAWGITFATMQQASLGVRIGPAAHHPRQSARRPRGHRAGDASRCDDAGPGAARPRRFDRAVAADRGARNAARRRAAAQRAAGNGNRRRPRRLPHRRRGDGGGARRRGEPRGPAFRRRVLRRLERHRRRRGRSDRGRALDARRATRWRGSAMRKASSARRRSRFRPGGSAVFDLVARGLPLPLSRPVRTILRSGCYVTHDSGFYERFLRAGPRAKRRRMARARRAQAGAGNLDARSSRDPSPVSRSSRSASATRRSISTCRCRSPACGTACARRSTRAGASTSSTTSTPTCRFRPTPTSRVGDLVGCGISHPCTTFDKWRWMPVVDDDYGVTGAIRTFF